MALEFTRGGALAGVTELYLGFSRDYREIVHGVGGLLLIPALMFRHRILQYQIPFKRQWPAFPFDAVELGQQRAVGDVGHLAPFGERQSSGSLVNTFCNEDMAVADHGRPFRL